MDNGGTIQVEIQNDFFIGSPKYNKQTAGKKFSGGRKLYEYSVRMVAKSGLVNMDVSVNVFKTRPDPPSQNAVNCNPYSLKGFVMIGSMFNEFSQKRPR